MMLKRLPLIFKFLILLLITISTSKAEILKPSKDINPKEVVKIQLTGLQKNDLNFKDSGIEQTWNFAHPNNKKVLINKINAVGIRNFKNITKIIPKSRK